MPPLSSSTIRVRSLGLTLIGTGWRAMPYSSPKHFRMEVFYSTFLGGRRPSSAVRVGFATLTEPDHFYTLVVDLTVVFRYSAAGHPDFEAAVPLSQHSLFAQQDFVLPFDNTNGFATGLALAYTAADFGVRKNGNATVLVTIRDSVGTLLR